uniref:Uncharacterized protein n=1 Tax=Globodera rostochiensis TaxID=31243 RepID=A0A914GW23_GLORO
MSTSLTDVPTQKCHLRRAYILIKMVQQFPPISHILNTLGSPQLMDTLNECLEYQNPRAIENTGRVLSNHGLNFIMAAVKQGIAEQMICRCCGEHIALDDLCYCPDAKTKCHHGTSCCETRKIVADGWPTFDHLQQAEQPIAVAVVELAVFPKFSVVLKENKCEGLIEMLEQLAESEAVRRNFEDEDQGFFSNMSIDLEEVGLHNMEDAFMTAIHWDFVCKKCKKQLKLDDICYCDDAKTKCHCNSRTCCTVTQEAAN